ncbi:MULTISPECIES: SPASM domain-containing protein [unclassified Streptomyces]|uniref:radical SAM/SPASM domain-containing protein n=1 Tax=unclassified Streptomyces TaxID=2593676 RepID=UPI000D147C14|nr:MULTISPECIES: SPASM domain-containing protein [unclassified Streptomyces]
MPGPIPPASVVSCINFPNDKRTVLPQCFIGVDPVNFPTASAINSGGFVKDVLEVSSPTVALPLVVEIEVNSRCNRRCGYCPVSILPNPPVPHFMEREVWDKLMDELVRIGFTGRISHHFYNEPLLRKDLEVLIADARARLPQSRQILFTNGDYLTDERYESLIAAGIDELIVTRHDFVPVPERDKQVVQMPTDLELSNRAGAVYEISSAVDLPCFAPTEMLVVTVTGDVVMCTEDAWRKTVVGNIMTRPLDDIWADERLVSLRRALEAGDRESNDLCRGCDNRNYPVAGVSP